jgi:hypothetical protein
MMRPVLVIAGLAGCYQPAYEDCQISCPDNLCPSGLTCVSGMCRTTTGPCGGGGSADAAEQGTWQKRRRVMTRGITGATVTDFPLLVRLQGDADLTAYTRLDGSDIRFTTVDGMKLPHELEKWDRTTGDMVAWVRVPSIPAGGTEIYMEYYNAAATPQENPEGVWDSNYYAVWHLSDAEGSIVADSTALNTDGAKTGNGKPASLPAGQIAGSMSFGAGGTDLLSFVAPSSQLGSTKTTFEAWVRRDGSSANLVRRILDFPAGASHVVQVVYPEDGFSTPGSFLPGSLGVSAKLNGGMTIMQTEANTLTANSWHHVGVTADGLAVTVYLDGVQRSLAPVTYNMPSTNVEVTVGGHIDTTGNPAECMTGLLDEVRLSNVVRPPAYFQLLYGNQTTSGWVNVSAPFEIMP